MEVVYMWPCQSKAGPEGTCKFHEVVTQMSMVSIHVTMPSAAKHAPIDSWGVPSDQVTEEEKTNLVYWWLCTLCRHHPAMDSYSITTLFWDKPESYRWRKIFTVGRNSGFNKAKDFITRTKWQPTGWKRYSLCTYLTEGRYLKYLNNSRK